MKPMSPRYTTEKSESSSASAYSSLFTFADPRKILRASLRSLRATKGSASLCTLSLAARSEHSVMRMTNSGRVEVRSASRLGRVSTAASAAARCSLLCSLGLDMSV